MLRTVPRSTHNVVDPHAHPVTDPAMQSASGNEKRKWDHTKVAKHERDFDAVGKGTTADPPSLLRLVRQKNQLWYVGGPLPTLASSSVIQGRLFRSLSLPLSLSLSLAPHCEGWNCRKRLVRGWERMKMKDRKGKE